MKYISLILVGIVAISSMWLAKPAYADTVLPDSDPNIIETDIYRNLRETGDMLFLVYANIPYTTEPSTLVSRTYIWSLIDTDNTTELGSTVGYAGHGKGFGYNVYSMYFPSANVTSLGMVWGTSYIIRLAGNPAVFTTPPIYNYPVSASNYNTLTDTADVKVALAAKIIELATDLDKRWGLSGDTSLLVELEAGTALSVYGQAVFRGAIYGVQSMAPAAFPVQIRDIEVVDRVWDTGYSENLSTQWGGTWVDTAQAAGKALFGTSYDLMSIIILLVLCGGMVFANVMMASSVFNGFIDAALVGVMGARLGLYDFGFLLLIAAICWIYISAIIWFKVIR